MRLTFRGRRAVVLAAGVAALAIPGAALAVSAAPVANGTYCINCTEKMSPGSFHIAKNGKTIDHWVYYNKCAPVPVLNPPAIAIKSGQFSFHGTLTSVIKKKLSFTLTGHFVSAHVVRGTANATGGGKSCKAVTFTAKFTRTGPFQF
jgi:hypothetical protein